MTTKANQSPKSGNKDFGLPQAEFKPIKGKGKEWIKITAIIVGIVLIIGIGVIYWFFHYPAPTQSQTIVEDLEYQEQGDYIADPDSVVEQEADIVPQDTSQEDVQVAHMDKVGEERVITKEPDTDVPNAAKSKQGTITKINTPQGCYYVIVGSYIDDDLALDHAHCLMQQGVDIMFLEPRKGEHFFRVAVEQRNIFSEAQDRAGQLKALYGPDLWVMKY